MRQGKESGMGEVSSLGCCFCRDSSLGGDRVLMEEQKQNTSQLQLQSLRGEDTKLTFLRKSYCCFSFSKRIAPKPPADEEGEGTKGISIFKPLSAY